MSFNYNGYSIADIAIHSIGGSRGLGFVRMGLSMEFNVPSTAPPKVLVRDLRARVYLSAEHGGEAKLLGVADPETSWYFTTDPGSNPRRVLFYLELTDSQLFEIEKLRGGSGLRLTVQVYGLAFGPTVLGPWAQNGEAHKALTLSDWSAFLSEIGSDQLLVVGLQLPRYPDGDSIRPAADRIILANRAMQRGHYDSAVAECRLALDSAMQIGNFSISEVALKEFISSPGGTLRGMSKFQREQLVGMVARHYSHLGHHVDKEGNVEVFSRDDATFILAIAAAVVASIARAISTKP